MKDALKRIEKAGLIVGAIVIAAGGLLMLPPDDLQTYQFPMDLRLGHEVTDLQQPDRNAAAVVSAVVYPKLLELIDR